MIFMETEITDPAGFSYTMRSAVPEEGPLEKKAWQA